MKVVFKEVSSKNGFVNILLCIIYTQYEDKKSGGVAEIREIQRTV